MNKEALDREILACSRCFNNEGLMLDADTLDLDQIGECPRCIEKTGKKLDRKALFSLAHRFFVLGSTSAADFGAAPTIQFNQHQTTDQFLKERLPSDVSIFEQELGVGFFHYGPPLWMYGYITPLEQLQDKVSRPQIVAEIMDRYPVMELPSSESFYRVRVNPKNPFDSVQYDSPPANAEATGRFGMNNMSVLYGSPDLQTCLHECRVSTSDEVYFAKLHPNRNLRLLNLCEILEENDNWFESLDLSLHFLFLAGEHSYKISREIAETAFENSYDGILFPSHFGFLRTGAPPFDSVYGMPTRRISQLASNEMRKIVPNIALFGNPIQSGLVSCISINRIFIEQVEYGLRFGPAIEP
jgi:hypothetical protein